MKRLVWSFVALFLLFAFPAPSSASPRLVINAWEEMMGTNLVLGYYSVGVLGDLYRLGAYKPARAKEALDMIEALLRDEQTFLESVKPQGGPKAKLLFREVKAVVDMLLLTTTEIRKQIEAGSGASWMQFESYRQAAAQDLSKIFSHPALKQKRAYQGGYQAAKRALQRYLGTDLIYGYVTTGLLADGYFRLALTTDVLKEFSTMALRVLRGNTALHERLAKGLGSSSRATFQRMSSGLSAIVKSGEALNSFVQSRNRAYLGEYLQRRKEAWSIVSTLRR